MSGRFSLYSSSTSNAIIMISTVGRRFGAFFFAAAICFVSSLDVSAGSPAGVYRGEWRSGSTGHRGPMRAAVQSSADGTDQRERSDRQFSSFW